MKQRIDISDLQQLTPEQQERLREWWQPQKYDWVAYTFQGEITEGLYQNDPGFYAFPKKYMLPLLSIGQMIELLADKVKNADNCRPSIWQWPAGKWNVETLDRTDQSWGDKHIWIRHKDELCDALWEAVKEVL